jgi:predicted lipid-binding transport protein (Tim44 family)
VANNFTLILRDWSNRNAEAMAPGVSSRYLAWARDALDALDREFQINGIADAELRDVALARPSDEAATGPVDAYLGFVARDWKEDLRTGEILDGDATAPRAFTKRWTFVSEGRRGWVVDRIESVWTGPVEEMAEGGWPGLPAGWYSTKEDPSAWRQWDGSAWVDAGDEGADAGD